MRRSLRSLLSLRSLRSLDGAALWLLSATPLLAQSPAASVAARLSPDLWKPLHWRNIGPEGNHFAAADIPGDPLTMRHLLSMTANGEPGT